MMGMNGERKSPEDTFVMSWHNDLNRRMMQIQEADDIDNSFIFVFFFKYNL